MRVYIKQKIYSLGLLLLGITLITSCDDLTGSSENAESRQVKVTMSVGGENSFDISGTPTASSWDTNEVELSLVRLLVDNLELENTSEDSVDFEVDNLIVDLPLDGDTLEITTQQIPAGSYDELDIEIDADFVEDSLLNDSTGIYSIVVQGTYNDEEFTFRTKKEFEEEFKFDPPIEITDSTNTLTLNLSINIERWFKHADPTDPDDQERIERNIKKSFNAYCRYDDHKWWQRDDKDDDDDDRRDDDKDDDRDDDDD